MGALCFSEALSYERSLLAGWLSFSLAVRRPSFSILWDTCRAPWVIAPWRGEREWVPASNLALCQIVGLREDGRTLRFFRGRCANFYSPPLGSPISGVHRPCWRARSLPSSYMGLAALSLFLAVSQLSVCMCPTCGFGTRYSCSQSPRLRVCILGLLVNSGTGHTVKTSNRILDTLWEALSG